MDITLSPRFNAGDKVVMPVENSGRTTFFVAKIDDILKIEKLPDDSYKIYYTLFIYDKKTLEDSILNGTTPTYKVSNAEESTLLLLETEFLTLFDNF